MASPATTNLSDAFGTPATEIGNILPKRAPKVSRERAEVNSSDVAAKITPAIAQEVEPKILKQAEPEAITDNELTRPVPIYVLPDVILNLRSKTRGERITNAQLALDALDQTHHSLQALIKQRRSGPARDGSIFPARETKRRPTQTETNRRRLWTFQATDTELTIIDKLVRSSKAESRSELIGTALEHLYK